MHDVLKEMNFRINLIMYIIKSNEFAILWNKEQLPSFAPFRGIRQGDRLLPYFFVMCMEKLSHLINVEVGRGTWKPLAITRTGPFLSHICFADDLM